MCRALGRSPSTISSEVQRNGGWRIVYLGLHESIQAAWDRRGVQSLQAGLPSVLSLGKYRLVLRRQWSSAQIVAGLS